MSQPITIFLGPRLKIERADKHIDELKTLFDSFTAGGHAHGILTQNYGGAHGIAPQFKKTLPPHVATILGDALHNLRAALDHLYVILTERNGQMPGNWCNFPIARDKVYVDSQLTTKNPNPSEAMMKLIIDKVRPYHGGNDLLVALHELDILDKHVVLIPTLKAIRIARISAKNPDGSQAFSFKNLTIGESGNLIQDAGIPGFSPPFMMISGYTVEQEKIDSTLEVVFGPNHPLARRNVVEALHEIRHTVSGIVDIFEAEIARADTT